MVIIKIKTLVALAMLPYKFWKRESVASKKVSFLNLPIFHFETLDAFLALNWPFVGEPDSDN